MAYALEDLSSIAEIRNVQERYCRASTARTLTYCAPCTGKEAQDEHGVFRGDREGCITWVIPLVRVRFAALQHVLGQTHTELDGDFAYTETNFVQHSLRPDGTAYASPGRYIDRFQRRNGQWRILEGKTMMSFFYPTEAADDEKRAGAGFPAGCTDREDPHMFAGRCWGIAPRSSK